MSRYAPSRNNPGFIVLNDSEPKTEQTIVVTGIGRSGTTAMMTCLTNMGLYNGGFQRENTLDDWGIGPLWEQSNSREFLCEVHKRNSESDVWGFKWHLLFQKPYRFSRLRNPKVICMFRDPIAITGRSASHDLTNLSDKDWLRSANMWQSQLLNWVDKYESPLMLVSCEKFFSNTEQIVQAVSRFTGLQVTPASLQCITQGYDKGCKT